MADKPDETASVPFWLVVVTVGFAMWGLGDFTSLVVQLVTK